MALLQKNHQGFRIAKIIWNFKVRSDTINPGNFGLADVFIMALNPLPSSIRGMAI